MRIVLPQAAHARAAGARDSTWVSLFKDTSLVSIISRRATCPTWRCKVRHRDVPHRSEVLNADGARSTG